MGASYTYGGSQPHAVTAIGSNSYTYDDNGNMTDRDGQSISWDVENRPDSTGSATFVYDGDGNRVKKTEGGETILYINRYYEINLDTEVETTSYYLGSRLIAQLEDETLRYVHQDNLTGTSVMSDDTGSLISNTKYYPFGATRSGSVPTDKQFTGQRLDGTGLYYYGARYYDPSIGRFISADTVVQPTPQSGGQVVEALVVYFSDPTQFQSHRSENKISFINPQEHNRYSYVLNNPLKYTDPKGSFVAVATLFAFTTSMIINAIIGATVVTVGTAAIVLLTKGVCDRINSKINSLSEAGGGVANPEPPDLPEDMMRGKLLKEAKNEDLRKVIREIYHPGGKFGDGGTADFIRKFPTNWGYIINGLNYRKNLYKMLTDGSIEGKDWRIAYQLWRDLTEALRYAGQLP